jgi:HPt (histidine-containing phosphotransfer) domain-containing protein
MTAARIVEVEAWLAHLIPQFLANRHKDAMLLRRAIDDGDFDTIRVLGHNLRGTAGAYGFAALEDLGLRLEVAAATCDVGTAAACCDELVAYMRAVTVVYR